MIFHSIPPRIELDEELKVITLIVKQVNSFVSIHMENKYKGILNVINGEIFTKKDDHNYHGFGLLSIKSIVEKYKGNISIDTKNNISNPTIHELIKTTFSN